MGNGPSRQPTRAVDNGTIDGPDNAGRVNFVAVDPATGKGRLQPRGPNDKFIVMPRNPLRINPDMLAAGGREVTSSATGGYDDTRTGQVTAEGQVSVFGSSRTSRRDRVVALREIAKASGLMRFPSNQGPGQSSRGQ